MLILIPELNSVLNQSAYSKFCDKNSGFVDSLLSVWLNEQVKCLEISFFTEPVETSQMAENAPDTNIFFVPGFNGLQAPINDPSATAGFIGKLVY